MALDMVGRRSRSPRCGEWRFTDLCAGRARDHFLASIYRNLVRGFLQLLEFRMKKAWHS